MITINRSKPVCEVGEEEEKREVCSFTYTQVNSINIVIFIIIVVVIIIIIIIFIVITQGSHTVAAVAVEMMMDLRRRKNQPFNGSTDV